MPRQQRSASENECNNSSKLSFCIRIQIYIFKIVLPIQTLCKLVYLQYISISSIRFPYINMTSFHRYMLDFLYTLIRANEKNGILSVHTYNGFTIGKCNEYNEH